MYIEVDLRDARDDEISDEFYNRGLERKNQDLIAFIVDNHNTTHGCVLILCSDPVCKFVFDNQLDV